MVRKGIVLTEAQITALERKQLDDEVSGEIDTAHLGYLGSQDTFYVGTLKGVGLYALPKPSAAGCYWSGESKVILFRVSYIKARLIIFTLWEI